MYIYNNAQGGSHKWFLLPALLLITCDCLGDCLMFGSVPNCVISNFHKNCKAPLSGKLTHYEKLLWNGALLECLS